MTGHQPSPGQRVRGLAPKPATHRTIPSKRQNTQVPRLAWPRPKHRRPPGTGTIRGASNPSKPQSSSLRPPSGIRPHNAPSGAVTAAPSATQVADHIGGSARGYQGLPAPLAIPATAHPDSGEIVFLCIASTHVNLLFCRWSCGSSGRCFVQRRRAGRRGHVRGSAGSSWAGGSSLAGISSARRRGSAGAWLRVGDTATVIAGRSWPRR
jgi:hypothetical protein